MHIRWMRARWTPIQPQMRRVHTGFHNWHPGSLYTPAPLREVDLQAAYMEILTGSVRTHLEVLAKKFQTQNKVKAVMHYLLSAHSHELKDAVAQRTSLAKQRQVPSESYTAFLRELHAPRLSPKKLKHALLKLVPRNAHGDVAAYIAPAHLETLISRTMDCPQIYPTVFEMLQRSELPLTARELATNVWHSAVRREDWREALTASWPKILASKDTGALNLLLKSAFKERCRSTQSLVQYHMKPDRFTYLLRLRHDHNPQDIMHQFRKQQFVIDIVVVSAYMSALLRTGDKQRIAAAESVFERLAASSVGIKPVFHNQNQLGNCLMALDTVNQTTNANIELPLIVDGRLMERMYAHYVSQKRHREAVDTLAFMARQAHIPSRYLVLRHIRDLAEHEAESTGGPTLELFGGTPPLEALYYLCCDINIAHPGFMSENLAMEWAKVIARRGFSYEDAEALVARNSVPVNS